MADVRRKKSYKPYYIIMAVMAAVIAVLLVYIVPYRYNLNVSESFKPQRQEEGNPLMGFAPDARNTAECEHADLVYIGLTWAQWEPAREEFATEWLEETYHIEEYKDAGKHAVLRFVCDVPGEAGHRDIPNWLYRSTMDGSEYTAEFGSGYSPDYNNELFMEEHDRALAALAAYCNSSDFVSYVELGSVGHWGEWHTDLTSGATYMPTEENAWNYVLAYTDSFTEAKLLMRRNYEMAVDGELGVYNDMIGDQDSTDEWLSWLEDGGTQESGAISLSLVPEENFWEKAPVGGEFCSSIPMEEMLDERLGDTLEQLDRMHLTFIGPKIPEYTLSDQAGYAAILDRIGYKIYVKDLAMQYNFRRGCLDLKLNFANDGAAPFYWDWPVTLYVYGDEEEPVYWQTLDLNLSELAPGKEIEVTGQIPFTDILRQGFTVGIGILSPDEENRLSLAMESEDRDGIQIFYTYVQ